MVQARPVHDPHGVKPAALVQLVRQSEMAVPACSVSLDTGATEGFAAGAWSGVPAAPTAGLSEVGALVFVSKTLEAGDTGAAENAMAGCAKLCVI
jgi:hypothetical protein